MFHVFFLGIYIYIHNIQLYAHVVHRHTHTHIYIYIYCCYVYVFASVHLHLHVNMFDARHDLCPRHSGEGTAARQDTNRSNWDGTSSGSMDWLKEGTSTGNHRISHEKCFFVVNCPLNQSN